MLARKRPLFHLSCLLYIDIDSDISFWLEIDAHTLKWCEGLASYREQNYSALCLDNSKLSFSYNYNQVLQIQVSRTCTNGIPVTI